MFPHVQVRFSAKLDPTEKVTFNLRYEELLQRSDQGKYSYAVNIQPQNQKIPDFKINVAIDESLPLKDISVMRVKNKNEAKFEAENITKEVLTYDRGGYFAKKGQKAPKDKNSAPAKLPKTLIVILSSRHYNGFIIFTVNCHFKV